MKCPVCMKFILLKIMSSSQVLISTEFRSAPAEKKKSYVLKNRLFFVVRFKTPRKGPGKNAKNITKKIVIFHLGFLVRGNPERFFL